MMLFSLNISRKLVFTSSIQTQSLFIKRINSKLKFTVDIPTILLFKVHI